MNPRSALALPILVTALAGGCEGRPPSSREPALLLAGATTRWWANEDTLLELNDNGSYARYASANGYSRAVERGRYEPSYASLLLEPYTTVERTPVRLQVESTDDGLTVMGADGRRLRPEPYGGRLFGTWTVRAGVRRALAD